MSQKTIETLSVYEAWEQLSQHKQAYLVDVRTIAEWGYVGVVDLSMLGKKPVLVSWQLFPTMQVNADFEKQIRGQGLAESDILLFLCRSGVRSLHAAAALSEIGFQHCYNIEHGFEGQVNTKAHRGGLNGWKQAGLAWRQT